MGFIFCIRPPATSTTQMMVCKVEVAIIMLFVIILQRHNYSSTSGIAFPSPGVVILSLSLQLLHTYE